MTLMMAGADRKSISTYSKMLNKKKRKKKGRSAISLAYSAIAYSDKNQESKEN